MSTPTDPPDRDGQPQDPNDPPNPYGQPQPPQPPSQPPTYGGPSYGEQPSGQPDYGQQPPPAEPSAPPPPAQPAPTQPYGQPTGQPYGQPTGQPFGQPYGQPAGQPGYAGSYPVAPDGQQPAGKGLAITSLVLGIIGCAGITAVVSIVLGIVVLVRGKDGRNHGKGLAIAGIVLSVLWLIGLGILVAVGVFAASTYSSVDDLKTGTCFTATGLDSSNDAVSLIKKVDCSTAHNGEVLATHTLSSSEASGYNDQSASQLCQSAVTDAGKANLVTGDINVVGLTQTTSPSSGDNLACVAFNSDGSKLTGPLG